jgi:hypothetical protein
VSFAADTFSGATATALENPPSSYVPSGGGTWSLQPTFSTAGLGFQLTSAGRARANTTGISHDLISHAPATNEYDVQADLTWVTTPAGSAGVLVRASNADGSGYLVGYAAGAGGWVVYKYSTSGVGAQVGATVAFSPVLGSTHTLRATVRNSGGNPVLQLYVDGSGTGVFAGAGITDSISPLTAAGYAGIHYRSDTDVPTDGAGIHLDNSRATDVATSATDTFTDSAGVLLEAHTSNSGGTWTKQPLFTAGQLVIDTSGTLHSSTTVAAHDLYSQVPATNEYDVTVDLLFQSVTGSAGVLLRSSTTDGSSYLVGYSQGLGGWQVWKYDATGALSFVGSVVPFAATPNTTHTIKVTVRNNAGNPQFQLYLDGSSTGVFAGAGVVDSTSPYTRVGLAGVHRLYTVADTDTTGIHLDNFVLSNPPNTFGVSPGTVGIGGTGLTLTLKGTGTSWTPGSPGTPVFTLSGGTGAAIVGGTQVITTAGDATLQINAGSAPAILTLTDPVSGATAQISVIGTTLVTDPHWFFSPYNWYAGSGYMQASHKGSYCKTVFSGTGATLLVDLSRMGGTDFLVVEWSIDGKAFQTAQPTPSTTQIVLAGAGTLNAGTHTLEFYIAQVNTTGDRWTVPTMALRVTGLSLDVGAVLSAPSLQQKRILVLGDSIVEGGYNVATAPNQNTPTSSDGRQSYVFGLAAARGGEVGSCGWGGTGWTTSAANVPPCFTVGNDTLSHWDKYDASHSKLVNGLFSPPPDEVYVFHGRNDAVTLAANDAGVQARVSGWIAAVRAAAPGAQIFVGVPFSGGMRAAIVAAYQASQTAHADASLFLLDLGTSAQAGLTFGLLGQAASGIATFCSIDGIHPNVNQHGVLGSQEASAVRAAIATTATSTRGHSHAIPRGRS